METYHLERNIPSLKSATKYLSFSNKGLTLIENKSNFDELYLFNDPKHWAKE